MNWKQILFWSVTAAAIFYYLLLFGVFLFVRQEEMQLFVPAWWYIRELLFQPGGFCAVAGQWIIQYYRLPLLAVAVHTLLLIACGIVIYRSLRRFSDRGYLLLLSLLPILYLLDMTVHGEYLVDGTVGVLLMLVALLFQARIRRWGVIAGYGIVSTCLLGGLAGILSVYYALLYTLFGLMGYTTTRQRLAAATCLLPALFIGLFSGWLGIPVPLYDGWKPEEYLEIQRLPDYYIYRVWAFFALGVGGACIFARLFPAIGNGRKWRERGICMVCLMAVAISVRFCLPEPWHAQRMMLDELAFLAREKQWDAIIDKYRGKRIHDYVSLNYLNMSLAHKGELADRMFAFDQKGTKSLCADWNQTFYMDRLLSDVHFLVGDVALSESLAMDGFTQAKRKGSARMLQRLVQVSLIRGEMGLAKKYLDLLAAMPFYTDWASRYTLYLERPELMDEDPEMRNKDIREVEDDRLSLSMSADSLWGDYRFSDNRIGWEYRGCHYLLDKNLDAFRQFLKEASFGKDEPMPRHFQEAGLLLAEKDSALLSSYSIRPEIADRYRDFRRLLGRSANQVDVSSVYRQFGDTYWFYYYFKIFKGEKQ